VTATRALADFTRTMDATAVPAGVRHETARIIVDCVGCAAAGLVNPAGRIALDLVQGEHGRLEATAIGAGRVSLLPAVFANTVLTNALDFEPVGPEGHVCAVAVPVALAVGEALNASGEEVFGAVVAGLEIGGRVGGAIRRVEQAGAKTTPAVRGTAHAVFAAVAAAGRLLRLNPEQMHHAFGIAGYSATLPTLKKVMSSPHAPMTKYDHLGLMAHNGVQAALLAQRDFTGDLEVLEGEFGFWRFAGALGCDWDVLLATTWTIPDTWFKRYPVILYATPGLDVLRSLKADNKLRVEEIEHVEIRALRTNPVQAGKDVRDEMDAWTSYAYNAAAALYDIHPWRAWQQPETYTRRDLLDLIARIDLRPLNPDEVGPPGNYWEGWCPVRASFKARGQRFEGAQERLPRLDDTELSGKFQENVAGLVADPKALEQACWDLPSISGRELAVMLSPFASLRAGSAKHLVADRSIGSAQ
jgi:2-methylcitrate dehydratase PrpD